MDSVHSQRPRLEEWASLFDQHVSEEAVEGDHDGAGDRSDYPRRA